MSTQYEPPKTQKRFGTIWAELQYVCGKIHYWLYIRKHESTAWRYQSRLEAILEKLPENDLAILREEGLALLHELRGEVGAALKHRKREIQLMERLHKDAETGEYAESTRRYMLTGRDQHTLRERRAILKALEEREPAEKTARVYRRANRSAS